ncbi:MAG: DUF2946 domain-containing protein [Betaproteobacteria bacterium]|nr:DUF2946 domain-containing protein [Betaproteobacteria bacterium]
MLHRLRHAHLLARFVLVWFALSIGAALASPLVNPQSMELICSGTGVMKVLVKTDDGVKEASAHTLDCPLCATMFAPAPMNTGRVSAPSPLSYALQPFPAARIAALTGAPLPARGPPSSI